MIPVVWLSYDEKIPARGYWDQGMLEALFANELWSPVGGYIYTHHESLAGLDGAIVVFPTRAQIAYVERLNNNLAALKWVVLILTGDEEASFPIEKLRHPNMRLWVMSPRQDRAYPKSTRFLGTGWPPQARFLKKLQAGTGTRDVDIFFAGQVTHERRQACIQQLRRLDERGEMRIDLTETDGFAKGLPQDEYYRRLSAAKIAVCPSGPETPDTFRLFEALEAGCVPIADAIDPKGVFKPDYWTFFFGEEPPFLVITDYEQLPGYAQEVLAHWKPLANKIFAWWMQRKQQMAYELIEDIKQLSGCRAESGNLRDLVTVIIPSSPIVFHPDTAIIEETIASIRSHLPDCEIIITLDGVRPEQEPYRERYEEYKRRLLWLCHHKWLNILPIIFDTHMHQASMARKALHAVKTPVILYVEHDTPLTPDNLIGWQGIVDTILRGDAHVVRLHHEALILPEHEHLMFDKTPVTNVNGVLMRRTMQWSQRPHVASTAFYRQMLDNYFNPASRTMIEDVMHGVVLEACQRDGLMGWLMFRLWIYTPEGHIQRSYHLDGRGADPKFDMQIISIER